MEPDRFASPDWSALNGDPNWNALWSSPHSFLFQEIERLESELHDTRITDQDHMIGTKHRLAALRWLRDSVRELAAPRRPNPEPSTGARRAFTSPRLRQRMSDLFNRVTHPSIG